MQTQLEKKLTKEVKKWQQKKEGYKEPSLNIPMFSIQGIMHILTKHIKDTDNPQTYIVHGRYAFMNSFKLLMACTAGVLHSVFPWWFKFTTSTAVIRAFKLIVDSKRHRRELQNIMPDYINKDKL